MTQRNELESVQSKHRDSLEWFGAKNQKWERDSISRVAFDRGSQLTARQQWLGHCRPHHSSSGSDTAGHTTVPVLV
jgi:hypothetical protein